MKSRRVLWSLLLLITAANTAFAVVITPTSITYTGTGIEFFTDENRLIDGSGLSGALDPTGANINTITHGGAGQATGWVTDDPTPGGGDYYVDSGGATVTFDIDLGSTFSLVQFASWPYNFGASNGNTLAAATLEFSTNGGSSFDSMQDISIPLVTAAPANANIIDLAPVDADFIRMTVTDNHFGGPAAGGDRVGLAEIRFLDDAAPSIVNLNINRDDGAITFRNDSPSAISFAGLGMTSDAGAFNPANWSSVTGNYDSGGNSSVSGNEWNVFAAENDDLSEGTLGSGTLAAGASVDLGTGAWVQSPNEDVNFVYLDAASGDIVSVFVNYSGTTLEDPIEIGDLNFDGAIDELDWPTYRDGYREDLSALSQAQAYQMGDLNGDGVNNAVDFGIFKTAYETNNPGASFAALVAGASVPEPTTLAMLMMGAMVFGLRRRIKPCAAAMVAVAALLLISPATSQAALPTVVSHWNLDSDATDSVGSNDGTATAVTFGTAGANANTGTSASFDGSTSTIDVPFSTDVNPESFTVSLWAFADTASAPHQSAITSRDDVNLGESTHGYILYNAPGGNWEFWTGDGDPGWAVQAGSPVTTSTWTHLAIAFDGDSGVKSFFIDGVNVGSVTNQGYSQNGTVELENLHIGSGADDGGSFFFTGELDDVAVFDGVLTGTEIQNVAANGVDAFETLRLELIVDPSSGNASLVNSAGGALGIDQYEILSSMGSLDASGWDSIEANGQNGLPQGTDAGDGWQELGTPGANFLGEAYLQGDSTLADAESIALGSLFSTGGDQDLELFYRTSDGSIVEGIVTYAVSVGVDGDYNNNGIVDAADYAVWREALGVATSLPNEGGISPGVVDTADYNFWKSRFGATSGAGNLASPAVPEPSAMVLMFALFGGLALWTTTRRNGLRTMANNNRIATSDSPSVGSLVAGAAGGSAALATSIVCRPRANTLHRFAAPVVALAVLLVAATVANAAFDERAYLLGDDGSEGAVSNGVTVGGAPGNVVPGDTLDTSGPTGGRLDINVEGTPTYTAGALSTSTFGASFNGTSDRLVTGFSVNSPDAMWDNTTFFPLNNYRLNYDGIFNRGIQVWAKPNGGTTGVVQTIVQDSLQHGIIITASDTWAMTFDGDPNPSNLTLDSGLAVGSTGQTTGANANEVSANGYTHLMALSGAYIGIPGEPDVFDVRGEGSALGALFYVNGVAVSGTDDFFYDADITELSVGSSQDAAGDFYHGDLDDLRIFVWGDNSDTTATNNNGLAVGTDYGRLDLGETNEWIKAELAELGVTLKGDADLDGDVDDDDVTAFIDDWAKVRLVPEANGDQVIAGDWVSRRDNSDLNFDGLTDFADWFLLRADHPNSASLNLGELLAARSAPEPSTVALLAVVLSGCLLGRRRG